MIPEAHFGPVGDEPADWTTLDNEPDPDDEELEKTPEDVIMMLGFDPLELKEEKK